MIMKRLNIVVLLALMISCITVKAQKEALHLNLDYTYAIPSGSLKNDIVNNASPRGFNGELMYQINNQWGAGVSIGYQDFYQKYPRALYKTGEGETTSAVLSNSVQIMPILAKGQYNFSFKKPAAIQPYVSVGAGLGLINFTQFLGEFGGADNTAGFMVQAGAGIAVPFSKTGKSGFRAGGDYNFVTYNKSDFGNLENIAFKAGVYFTLE